MLNPLWEPSDGCLLSQPNLGKEFETVRHLDTFVPRF